MTEQLRCPTCGDPVDTTIQLDNGEKYPFCMKDKCSEARLKAVARAGKDRRRVSKVSYDGKLVLIRYQLLRKDGNVDEFEFKCHDQPAGPFKVALTSLREYIAEICQLPAEYCGDLEVRGCSYSYSDDGIMGVTITALKPLRTANAPLVLNTPHLMSAPMDDNDVQPLLSADQVIALDEVRQRAIEYVDGQRAQLNLFAKEKVESKVGQSVS